MPLPLEVEEIRTRAVIDAAHLNIEWLVYRAHRGRELERDPLDRSLRVDGCAISYGGPLCVDEADAELTDELTATAQGALAWYATYLTGTMAQTWFSQGKSWGSAGPRDTARAILASLDRDALIQAARQDITGRLRRS